MRLFNQTRHEIIWDGSGRSFAFEPYGARDVPDEFAVHMKTQGFPVAATPVGSEARAGAVLEAAREEQRSDEVESLKRSLSVAEDNLATANQAAESAQRGKAEAEKTRDAALTEASEQAANAVRADRERKAAEELLTETAKKLESAEAQVATLTARAAQAEMPEVQGAPAAKPPKGR